MEIIKVTPRGYCKGVVNAIHLAKQARIQYPKEKITILGMLVHNQYVVEALKEYNIDTIDQKGISRYDLLDQIKEGIVIFTAHGVSERVVLKAQMLGLKCIDATCPFVSIIHHEIKEKLKHGYEIGYLGKKGHPESEAVLELDSRIHLIENEEDINFHNEKLFFTNQTTLSYYEIQNLYQKIQEKYPHSIICNEICDATKTRQEAIMKLKNIDALIVVGDPKSHNTQKLASIGKQKTNHVYCVKTAFDLVGIDFHRFNRIAITSGASTPTRITNQVIHFLETNQIEDFDIHQLI
ncbi:MAG: 4-hydroxy-3-methylbut-2-enyl diphosphate reductase [Traorella sp.]